MRSMLAASYTKPLILSLVMALLTISTLAGPAEAMFVSSSPRQASAGPVSIDAGRAADLTMIQSALESKILRQKLMDYGLTPDEALQRVGKLTGEQIHQLATHADSLQAVGDAGYALFIILFIAILVALIIYLVQGQVEIR
jgi:hypothetical protein